MFGCRKKRKRARNPMFLVCRIKDAMKQMSRKGTSLIVSSSSSSSKGTSNHFRASQILSDNSLVADLTPMHPMLSDGDDTTALSSKNRPVSPFYILANPRLGL